MSPEFCVVRRRIYKRDRLIVPRDWLCCLAPEIVRRLSPDMYFEPCELIPFSKSADVFAFGTIWFEMLTTRLPLLETPLEALLYLLGCGRFPALALHHHIMASTSTSLEPPSISHTHSASLGAIANEAHLVELSECAMPLSPSAHSNANAEHSGQQGIARHLQLVSARCWSYDPKQRPSFEKLAREILAPLCRAAPDQSQSKRLARFPSQQAPSLQRSSTPPGRLFS